LIYRDKRRVRVISQKKRSLSLHLRNDHAIADAASKAWN
jgi:hypothetical protein